MTEQQRREIHVTEAAKWGKTALELLRTLAADRVQARKSVARMVRAATLAAHHAYAGQTCRPCGGVGMLHVGPCQYVACAECGSKGWRKLARSA